MLASDTNATASATVSAHIINPTIVKIKIGANGISHTESGPAAPDHRIIVTKVSSDRNARLQITYNNY